MNRDLLKAPEERDFSGCSFHADRRKGHEFEKLGPAGEIETHKH